MPTSGSTAMQDESESALCKNTLQGLKELGLEMGASFFPELLDTFEHDSVKRLAALRSAVAAGETGRLRIESHALKGASLTIGAQGMAEICQHLEDLGIEQSADGAPEQLARLEREFDRVKTEIQQERLIL
jgi:HPt (histidine-containing phosphotransfer) domain-containing protein